MPDVFDDREQMRSPARHTTKLDVTGEPKDIWE
jgi:hypothetical protein